jgi:maltodextrin utilization protein YvdJ
MIQSESKPGVMQSLSKVLYSNKAILSLKRMSGWLILLLFFVNTSLISAPLIVNRATITGEEILAQFPQIEETLEAVLVATPCVVTRGEMDTTDSLVCDVPPMSSSMNGYEITYFDEPVTSTYIYFAQTAMVIQYEESSFVGTYQFLSGQRLDEVLDEASLEDIVYALATGSATLDFFLIWLGQLLQNGMYFLIVSTMLLISNYQTKREKLRYKEALAIAVLAMIGPALIGGTIGLLEASLSGILFITVYSLRMMYLYFGLFTKNTQN